VVTKALAKPDPAPPKIVPVWPLGLVEEETVEGAALVVAGWATYMMIGVMGVIHVFRS
jgi:hypothetical protein